MVLYHKNKTKKPSGGKVNKWRDKRKREMGRNPAMTKVSEDDVLVRSVRGRSNIKKRRALRVNIANVLDRKTNKVTKSKIKKVIENTASRHFARMSIITKGAVIETAAGKAKVTNRPGQEGTINAVLLE